MPLEVLESVDSEQPLIIPVFDFMYTVTLVLILFAFAHLFSPWHSSSKLGSAHLAYRKRSLSRTFSRHGIAQASLTLLIWLNENVLLASADKVFGKRLKDKFMKKKKYECPSVVVTNVSFSIMSGSGGYDPYDPYYASTNFSEGEPVANTSLW